MVPCRQSVPSAADGCVEISCREPSQATRKTAPANDTRSGTWFVLMNDEARFIGFFFYAAALYPARLRDLVLAYSCDTRCRTIVARPRSRRGAPFLCAPAGWPAYAD